MDLQKKLDESGYTQALEDLNNMKAMRDTIVGSLETMTRPEKLPQLFGDLFALEEWIKNTEAALAVEHAAVVKYVDANNDAELQMLQIEEMAELVAEELDKSNPAMAQRARAIMRGEMTD